MVDCIIGRDFSDNSCLNVIGLMPFYISFSEYNCFQAFYSPLLKPNTTGHFCKLALATVGNDNLLAGFPTLGPIGFHLLDHLHALYHLLR